MFSRTRSACQNAWNSSKKSYRNVMPLILSRQSAPYVTAGLLLTTMSAGLSLLIPVIYSKMVSQLTTREPLYLWGIEITPFWLVGIYGAVWTLNNLLSTFRNIVVAPLGPLASEKLATRYVQSRVHQSYSNHINTPSGLNNGMIGKCYMAPMNLTTNLFTQIVPPATDILIATSILAKWYGLGIGLGLGSILLLYIAYNISTKKTVTDLRNDMVKYGFQSYVDMVSVLENYFTIHLFDKDQFEMNRVKISLNKSAVADIKGNAIISKIGLGQVIIAGVGFTLLSMKVAYDILDDQFAVSDFIFVTTYLNQFSGPLGVLGAAFNAAIASIVEVNAVCDKIEEKSDVIDEHPDVPLVITPQNARIEFRNVSFSYTEKSDDGEESSEKKELIVLDNVSFVIEPGQSVGFVGKSGAGKSTIVNLIYRFSDVKQGEIFIGGQNIKDVGIKSLRANIGIVPQTTPLFSDTIYNNVAYGAPEAKADVKREKVLKAIDDAHMTQTVLKFRKQYETMVGEGGAKLSGGQRQRIAIARTIAKNPPILMFDEATAALDTHSERAVQKNIEANSKGKTSIFIAHRLTTLRNVNVIFVLDEGKIAERGTHAELITRPNGIYAELWQQENKRDHELLAEDKSHFVVRNLQASQLGMFSGENSADEKLEHVHISILGS